MYCQLAFIRHKAACGPLCPASTQHAAVRCNVDDHHAFEQSSRYITRPALASDRVQCNYAGQVVLKLKTPWHDSTTHLMVSPLEFMQLPVE